jgi:MSHA biogenesis protein MshQ
LVIVALVAACSFEAPFPGGGPEPDAGVDAAIDPEDSATPRAWLRPWARRKAITLLASQIEAPGDAALTDFPVLVSVTDPQLAASALAGGEDIVFTAGDATTVLASELESFTPTTGQLVAWVKVPSLPATTDTRLYLYYGNPSPPPRTPEAVWTSSHLAVWHLHQDPGPGGEGEIRDATGGNHDGTAANMESSDSVPARIGRGLKFNGIDEDLSFDSMDVGNAFTISMWIAFTGGSNVKPLIANSATGRDQDGFRFFVNTAGTSDRKLIFETGSGDTASGRTADTGAGALPLDTLTHVAAVVDRTAATALLYVNGASVAVDTSIGNNFETRSGLAVARMKDALVHFPGTVDQIEVARALRAPEWIRTSFNNQSQPTSFHALDPEELAP